MEEINIDDMIAGNVYSIDNDGYQYKNYIYLGKHFYRMDDAQYMFQHQLKNNKLNLWSPFRYKVYQKTKLRNKILKKVLCSFLDESMAEIISKTYL